MKHNASRNARILSLFLILSIFPLGQSATAWKSYSTTIQTVWVGNGNADGMVVAENGDVVTTDKWNQLSEYVRNLWYVTTDGMRGRTGFIQGRNDMSGGVPWYVVNNINLPTSRSDELYGLGGSIMFKDPSLPYTDTTGWKGGIYWRTADQSMVLYQQWGIRISGNPADANSYKLLGWEKISLYDTASYDAACQYRIKTTLGQTLYPAVRGEVLSIMEDSNWVDNIAIPVHMRLMASNKTSLEHYHPDGTTSKTHGDVTLVEKFCLPSYNPNNY